MYINFKNQISFKYFQDSIFPSFFLVFKLLIEHGEILILKLFKPVLNHNFSKRLNYSDQDFVYLVHLITLSRCLHYFNFECKQATDNFIHSHHI
jgi:hypothetical protein